jgi:hypothetical protein
LETVATDTPAAPAISASVVRCFGTAASSQKVSAKSQPLITIW